MQARTVQDLRAGPQADYLKSKGHALWILDDDSVGANGQPVLPGWMRAAGNPTLPALIIATDSSPPQILHKGPWPDTADAVITQLQQAGG